MICWADEEVATFASLLNRFNDALGVVYCPPVPRPDSLAVSTSSSPAEQELA